MSSKEVQELREAPQQQRGAATTQDIERHADAHPAVQVEGEEEAGLLQFQQPRKKETEKEERGDDFRYSLPGPSTSTLADPSGYNVKVPGWRVIPVPTARPGELDDDGEEVEDLDDAAFERRHRKYELAERRQIRWDLQLQRDEARLERQKLKEALKKTEAERGWPSSFCGELKDVKVIEVVDEIPAIAFGRVLPVLERSDFSLPWLEEKASEPKRTSNKRQKGKLSGGRG
ncbi:male-specific lethal 1 homolog [Haemaphysalis longicornis]